MFKSLLHGIIVLDSSSIRSKIEAKQSNLSQRIYNKLLNQPIPIPLNINVIIHCVSTYLRVVEWVQHLKNETMYVFKFPEV